MIHGWCHFILLRLNKVRCFHLTYIGIIELLTFSIEHAAFYCCHAQAICYKFLLFRNLCHWSLKKVFKIFELQKKSSLWFVNNCNDLLLLLISISTQKKTHLTRIRIMWKQSSIRKRWKRRNMPLRPRKMIPKWKVSLIVWITVSSPKIFIPFKSTKWDFQKFFFQDESVVLTPDSYFRGSNYFSELSKLIVFSSFEM